MIISKTPLRVSFFGGGTDIKDYYSKCGGAVFSATIDKYIYVIVKSRYDNKIVLNYFKHEEVDDINKIEHEIIKEALKITGITKGIEITSMSDIPSEGSGLGSSSSFTVGLLNALFAYKGECKSQDDLAKLACSIEIDILGEPIGKQDQYAAAFGGFKKYFFSKDDTVEVEDANISNEIYKILNMHTMMFYTGITRRASSVLSDQKKNINSEINTLNRLKEFALNCQQDFMNPDICKIGAMLDVSWQEKKKLSKKIHNDEINSMYDIAKKAGAYGGKLLGAGGGGFFLFLCPLEKQQKVRKALKQYKELPVTYDKYGSRIILNSDDHCSFIKYKTVENL
ncbi:GHMP kinase [Inconstantimicrobium mannanitabidum]|uniref:GHMP kinase n=1 Tax=Inconstantimicrobium mannanitabidum TaxID=1604901 RepID=A0ACB5RE99_9CLOT|nr:GHMP kinase [Clostridium sp. TW13]GKX67363.1 GHMP kinase [Clostridium sp. TW13]